MIDELALSSPVPVSLMVGPAAVVVADANEEETEDEDEAAEAEGIVEGYVAVEEVGKFAEEANAPPPEATGVVESDL